MSIEATTPVVGEADPVRAFVKRVMVWRLADYDKSTIKSAMFLTPHQVDIFEFELRKLLATVIPTVPDREEIVGVLKEVREWRPIETAPKDGTYVLLANVDGSGPCMGFWGEGTWSNGDFRDDMGPFTHWMPLPEPPVGEGE